MRTMQSGRGREAALRAHADVRDLRSGPPAPRALALDGVVLEDEEDSRALMASEPH